MSKSQELAPATPAIPCTSRVTSVSVHARGALVTRTVRPEGALPPGRVSLHIPGVTASARAHGARCSRLAGRDIIALRAKLEHPLTKPTPSALEQQNKALARAARTHREQLAELERRRAKFAALRLTPHDDEAWQAFGPLEQTTRALAIDEIIDARLSDLDTRRATLLEQIEALEEETSAVSLAIAQATSANTSSPHWCYTLELDGEGELEEFELHYVVDAVRWWPLYTLRLSDGGAHAELILEAALAQRTGEDWSQVNVSLSTADLMLETTLPSLPALKLGKRQPLKPTGYREPPGGLDRLFISYDQATGSAVLTPEPARAPFEESPARLSDSYEDRWDDDEYGDYDDDLDDGVGSYGAVEELAAPAPSFAAPAAPAGMPAPDFAPRREMVKERSRAAMPPKPKPSKRKKAMAKFEDAHAEPTQLHPEEAWLDFDALELADAGAGSQRGKLRRRPSHSASRYDDLGGAMTQADKLGVFDPLTHRGHYDHSYATSARFDVPSDGNLHRVEVQRATSWASLWWRAVPVEGEEVYRMARLTNPLDAPLLRGPMEVFVEGSFLLRDELQTVGRGAELTIGLGVDERITTTRDVRTNEEHIGLLSQKTSIEHVVETTITSNLGFDAAVEVLDRVPISGHDQVDVVEVDHTPTATPWTQEGTLKGGRRWELELSAGQRTRITSNYKIVLSSREEIIGGNRRD